MKKELPAEAEHMIEDEHSIKEENLPALKDIFKELEYIKSHCDKIIELTK